MKWSADAEDAIRKVPFFVRKRVRARVEQEARTAGKKVVSLADMQATQRRYLSGMSRDVKGYRIDMCFGPNGCPNRAVPGDELYRRLEELLQSQDLLGFLRQRVRGDLKFHHEFRISLADCPNACSQPQIKDVGILGAVDVRLTEEPCTACGACVDVCREGVFELDGEGPPRLALARCVACGQCVKACPTGTLAADRTGFRVLLGGKLGRHPRLARELPGIYSADQVLQIVGDCLAFYKAHSRRGERFAELMTDAFFDDLTRRYGAAGGDPH